MLFEENLFSLVFAATPLLASPGPATLSVAAASAVYGLKSGIRYSAGVTLGTQTVVLHVVSGVQAALFAMPAAGPVLQTLGVSYLLYLAWKIARAPAMFSEKNTREAPGPVSGYILGVANPKAYAAIGSVVASHPLAAEAPIANGIFTALSLCLLVITVQAFWVWLGDVVLSSISNPVIERAANLVFALMLLTSLAWTLL